MADTIRQVDYFYMLVPHKAGEAAKALRALEDAGVNLVAFSGFPEGRRAQRREAPRSHRAARMGFRVRVWIIWSRHST